MAFVWKDKFFKQPCILTCFMGRTFVFETLECGDILAARISANPKVIFVQVQFFPDFFSRGYPALTLTRRLLLSTDLQLSVFGFYCAATRQVILEFLDSSQWSLWYCLCVVFFLRCIGASQVTTPRIAVQFGPRSDPGAFHSAGATHGSSPGAITIYTAAGGFWYRHLVRAGQTSWHPSYGVSRHR